MAKSTIRTGPRDPAAFEADVAIMLRMAGFTLSMETVAHDAMLDMLAEREEPDGLRRFAIECKAGLVGAAEANRALERFVSHGDPTINEFWLVSATDSPRAREVFRRRSPRYRYFSVDTLEAFISPKQQTKPSARTKVGKSIELNHAQLVLASTALIIQIDERLHALRSERPNSAEAIAERDQIVLDYDALRGELEALRQSIADFKTGRTKESDVVKRVDSFSDGVRSWWSKRHEMICDKVLDMSLFLSAVTICSLAGASGNMAVATSAVLVGGKPVVEALKSIGKKLLK